ncbi:lipoprotein [Streptomyces viridochromogenes DSM 40736]|uniref:Lipoprotein n=1 Tax=Streptomyces viridochromogenes (strain DSM 40736 / JCM 4977 / BCRC 1201 / Tue 494) TaxID=591159 RepID=D9XA27_STRVT|nr:lipoprotein [Streptomyces viridochromogenes DSM 40736]
MRGICVATAVLLGAGALTSCVPAADAAVRSDFGFSVDPSTVNPGGKVILRVDRNACRGEAAVSSPVFDVVTIAPWQSWTTAVVDWNAEPGDVYDVEFVCERTSGTARLTISGRPPADHPGHHPGPQGRHPTKGVHAGEGGPSPASTSRRSDSAVCSSPVPLRRGVQLHTPLAPTRRPP